MPSAPTSSLVLSLAIAALVLTSGCGEDSKKNPGAGEASGDADGGGGQGGGADAGGGVDAGQGGGTDEEPPNEGGDEGASDFEPGQGGDGGDAEGGEQEGGTQDGGAAQDGGGDDEGAAQDGGADGGEDIDYALAPEDFGGFTLVLVEPANDRTNSWVFVTKGGAGTATLGEARAPYTYAKDGPNASTLTFSVGEDDVYSMTWTGESTGTCTQSFADATPVDCTFEIE